MNMLFDAILIILSLKFVLTKSVFFQELKINLIDRNKKSGSNHAHKIRNKTAHEFHNQYS